MRRFTVPLAMVALAFVVQNVQAATAAAKAAPASSSSPAAAPVAEPIPYTKLLPLLPAPPEGWTAEEPDGSTTDAGGFKVTALGRTYHKAGATDEAEAMVNVNFTDYSANPGMLLAAMAGWSVTQDDADGYAKTITVDGCKGYEQYEIAGKTGNLWLLIGGRIIVQIEVQNLPASDLETWRKLVDLKKISEAK